LIINLRGTSGAGKTTIVRSVIRSLDTGTPIFGALGKRQPEAIKLHRFPRPLFALGPYPTAGCDAIVARLGVQGIIDLLEKYSPHGDVIFEGLIISSMFGAIGAWLHNHPPAIVAVLDVTMTECLAGLIARQGDRQRTARTQEAHHRNTFKIADKMRTIGMRVEMLKREDAVGTIWGWLE
jgi:hypothetical protein